MSSDKVIDPLALKYYREEVFNLTQKDWAAKKGRTTTHQKKIEAGWVEGRSTTDQSGRRADFLEMLCIAVQRDHPELFDEAKALLRKHSIEIDTSDGTVRYPKQQPGDTIVGMKRREKRDSQKEDKELIRSPTRARAKHQLASDDEVARAQAVAVATLRKVKESAEQPVKKASPRRKASA